MRSWKVALAMVGGVVLIGCNKAPTSVLEGVTCENLSAKFGDKMATLSEADRATVREFGSQCFRGGTFKKSSGTGY
jgi:hypothetical protein